MPSSSSSFVREPLVAKSQHSLSRKKEPKKRKKKKRRNAGAPINVLSRRSKQPGVDDRCKRVLIRVCVVLGQDGLVFAVVDHFDGANRV